MADSIQDRRRAERGNSRGKDSELAHQAALRIADAATRTFDTGLVPLAAGQDEHRASTLAAPEFGPLVGAIRRRRRGCSQQTLYRARCERPWHCPEHRSPVGPGYSTAPRGSHALVPPQPKSGLPSCVMWRWSNSSAIFCLDAAKARAFWISSAVPLPATMRSRSARDI